MEGHNMIMAYITRGIGPIEAATDAMSACATFGWIFLLVEGCCLVEAKQRASRAAIEWDTDLLMVEDDMLVSEKVWKAVYKADNPNNYNTIHYAKTNNRDGTSNERMTPSGKFLFTGTCFCRIPAYILNKMEQPMFLAYNFGYSSDGEQLIPKGPNEKDRGSDVYFWQAARQLVPQPSFQCLGTVGHIKHPLNANWNHQDPYITEIY
jgi:hypothetical protein